MRTIEEIRAKLNEAVNAGKTALSCAIMYRLLKAITDEITLDRLEEICNAERDGRLQILPCKKGDTVWARTSYFSNKLTETKAMFVWFNGTEYKVTCEGIGELTLGKSVFLSRESAEKALKGGV